MPYFCIPGSYYVLYIIVCRRLADLTRPKAFALHLSTSSLAKLSATDSVEYTITCGKRSETYETCSILIMIGHVASVPVTSFRRELLLVSFLLAVTKLG